LLKIALNPITLTLRVKTTWTIDIKVMTWDIRNTWRCCEGDINSLSLIYCSQTKTNNKITWCVTYYRNHLLGWWHVRSNNERGARLSNLRHPRIRFKW
jgi:hypothetical protein